MDWLSIVEFVSFARLRYCDATLLFVTVAEAQHLTAYTSSDVHPMMAIMHATNCTGILRHDNGLVLFLHRFTNYCLSGGLVAWLAP